MTVRILLVTAGVAVAALRVADPVTAQQLASISVPPPAVLKPLPAFIAVSAGYMHTCALAADSTAWCWGENTEGQLGVATETACKVDGGKVACSLRPVAAAGGARWRLLSAGGFHTCGFDATGGLLCWGMEEQGQLGAPTSTTCPLLEGMAPIPCSLQPLPVHSEEVFIAVSAGLRHTCALTATGAAYCWGDNRTGALGHQAGGTMCPDFAGSKVACDLEPAPVQGDHRFAAIAAGGHFTVALDSSGHAWQWGGNPDLGPGSALPVLVSDSFRFVSISAGQRAACGLTAEGQAFCWGIMPVAGGVSSTEIVEGNGQPVAVGAWGIRYRKEEANTRWRYTMSAVGHEHHCGILVGGVVACWGANDRGQLGQGKKGPSTGLPVEVPDTKGAIAVTAGNRHSCALMPGGRIICWGYGIAGQLGNGKTKDSDSPRVVGE